MRKITFTGTYSGLIWMPCVECYKTIDKTFIRSSDKRYHLDNEIPDGAGNLRYVLLRILNDGDFRGCLFDELTMTVEEPRPGFGMRIIERDLSESEELKDLFNEGPYREY